MKTHEEKKAELLELLSDGNSQEKADWLAALEDGEYLGWAHSQIGGSEEDFQLAVEALHHELREEVGA